MERIWIAVIRLRGRVGINPAIAKTLELLRLYRRNYCVIVKNSPDILGMLRKIQDYTTFGELEPDTFIKLLSERGRLASKKRLTEEYLQEKLNLSLKEFAQQFFQFKRELRDIPGLKLFFRLKPPTGGLERGGIKKAYAEGGCLGYRGKAINELLLRMI